MGVSKRASAHGKRMYKNVEDWTEAFMEARSNLRTNGFVAINGKSVFGKALYVKTKAIQLQRRRANMSLPTSGPAATIHASAEPPKASTVRRLEFSPIARND